MHYFFILITITIGYNEDKTQRIKTLFNFDTQVVARVVAGCPGCWKDFLNVSQNLLSVKDFHK